MPYWRVGWIRVTHPCAGRRQRYCYRLDAPRLACVKPVASVHPEPGSNSPLENLYLTRRTANGTPAGKPRMSTPQAGIVLSGTGHELRIIKSKSYMGRRLAARPCLIDGSYLYLCADMPPPETPERDNAPAGNGEALRRLASCTTSLLSYVILSKIDVLASKRPR